MVFCSKFRDIPDNAERRTRRRRRTQAILQSVMRFKQTQKMKKILLLKELKVKSSFLLAGLVFFS